VELYSTTLKELGYPPLPEYIARENEEDDPEVAKEFPLVLTTGNGFMPFHHSEHFQIKDCVSCATSRMWSSTRRQRPSWASPRAIGCGSRRAAAREAEGIADAGGRPQGGCDRARLVVPGAEHDRAGAGRLLESNTNVLQAPPTNIATDERDVANRGCCAGFTSRRRRRASKMARYAMVFDTRNVRLPSCSVACRTKNELPVDMIYNPVTTVGPVGVYPHVIWCIAVICMHCDNPPCVEPARPALPSGGRTGSCSWGQKCVGCLVRNGLPYGARTKNHDGCGAEVRFCKDRVVEGMLPYCVLTCHQKALFRDLDDRRARSTN
jgi:molybdopterin-containing oxidoreductase family iron-sulfur binding subunit